MKKTILITGSTDGIGLETAKMLYSKGHHILLHGRSAAKLANAEKILSNATGEGSSESYVADLSNMAEVESLAKDIAAKHAKLDVLINNAGVLRAPEPITLDGLDTRFAVNTIAPYLLTQRLLPALDASGRVVNLSSAAQAPVNLEGLSGRIRLQDMDAYAQSKLAITMWSCYLAYSRKNDRPIFVAVNPGSMLGSKMVKEGFGVAGGDIRIGAEILIRAALSDEFAEASGKYFDNDARRFASPHPDAMDTGKIEEVVRLIETILAKLAN